MTEPTSEGGGATWVGPAPTAGGPPPPPPASGGGAGALGPTGPTGWGPGSAARAGRHPAFRVLALALGGLLTLAIVAGASFAAANVLVRTTDRDSRTLEGTVTRAVIDVDGAVDVQVGPPGQAHIERRSTFGLRRPTVTRTLQDGILTVTATCGGVPGLCSNDVTVEVPAEAEISASGDRVSVTGFSALVEADSDGGSVELTDLSGPIDTRAGGGSVVGRELTTDQVRASVGAGAIDLQFTRPPSNVEATTGAGAVVIELPPDGTAYRVDAGSGAGSQDVQVATDPTSPRRIRAGTGAGSVEVRYGAG